ncbi:MAG: hypothetical protein BWY75_01204 [bacterium ADurb.Bin425]|nr:MAG: hypothetical protein BWY75_01204 [bacterium ADurb.Bin425]
MRVTALFSSFEETFCLELPVLSALAVLDISFPLTSNRLIELTVCDNLERAA